MKVSKNTITVLTDTEIVFIVITTRKQTARKEGRDLMKKPLDKRDDPIEMFHEQCENSPNRSTEDRIDKLETTVYLLFGFLLGMLLTHIVIHAF